MQVRMWPLAIALFVLPRPADAQVVGTCAADQTMSGSATNHQGWSLAVADFDGDGLDDILTAGGVGSPNVVRLYRGHTGSHGPSCEIPPTAQIEDIDVMTGATAWGISVAFLGDIDSGGSLDFAIGAPHEAGGLGEVYVFLGETFSGTPAGCGPCATACTGTIVKDAQTDADCVLTGTITRGRFGASLAAADFNGDGVLELAVGQPGSHETLYAEPTFAGLVRHFTATQITSSATLVDTNSTVTARGTTAADRFGFSLATSDDLDGDGDPDLIVGAIQANTSSIFTGWTPVNGPGYVRVLHGANFRTNYTITPSVLSGESLQQFGASVASVPDFTGDSVADIAVGAPGYAKDDASVPPVAIQTGAVYLYSGASGAQSGAVIAPQVSGAPDPAYGAPFESLFGHSVAGGDYDADGSGDVWIGAPRYRSEYANWSDCICGDGTNPACADTVGEVWLQRGSDHSQILRYRGAYGTFSSDKQRIGWSIAVGDIDGDSETDTVTPGFAFSLPSGGEDGRVYVFLQP